MIKFSVKVKVQKIPSAQLTQAQTNTIGRLMVKEIKDRVQNRHASIFDTPMPAYSPKPIYVKLGKAGGRAVIKSGTVSVASLNSLRKAGARIVSLKDASPKLRRKIRKLKNAVYNTGDSLRFPNRETYKRYLGKSGLRDLTETGAMLSALVIISVTGEKAKVITVGINDDVQERKALGNMKWADWWGMSPSNQQKVTNAIEKMVAKNVGADNA